MFPFTTAGAQNTVKLIQYSFVPHNQHGRRASQELTKILSGIWANSMHFRALSYYNYKFQNFRYSTLRTSQKPSKTPISFADHEDLNWVKLSYNIIPNPITKPKNDQAL